MKRADTVCTCRATDGMCHGWETGYVPIPPTVSVRVRLSPARPCTHCGGTGAEPEDIE